jgi:flavin reductase (DIM6/NTAB) family NADH-FMN oxidoreductase RutF
MKKRLGPSERLYPMPCPLVLGGTLDDAHALAVAWVAIGGSTPPTVMMALRRTRHTLEFIRATGEFTVNTPQAGQAAVVDYFGTTSGRAHDKFAECGWTLEPASVVSAPLIAECPYNLECRVTSEVEAGEYVIVIGEILEAHAEESVLDDAGVNVDVARLDPLIYIPGTREYRRIGEKVADAYSVGKTMPRLTARPGGDG